MASATKINVSSQAGDNTSSRVKADSIDVTTSCREIVELVDGTWRMVTKDEDKASCSDCRVIGRVATRAAKGEKYGTSLTWYYGVVSQRVKELQTHQKLILSV
jgi:hypothetical protein